MDHIETSSLGEQWPISKGRKGRPGLAAAFAFTISYAAEVFHDAHRLIWYDASHSDEEDRYVNIGKTDDEVVVVVVETESDRDEIRIITARKANKRERKAYADG